MPGDVKIRIYAKAARKIPAIALLSIFTIIALYQAGFARMLHLPRLHMGIGWDEKMIGIALFFGILTSVAIYQFKFPKAVLVLDTQGFDCHIEPKCRVEWEDLIGIEAQNWSKDRMLVPVLKEGAKVFENKRFRRSVKARMNRRLYGNSIVISKNLLAKPVDELVQIMMKIGNTGNRFFNE